MRQIAEVSKFQTKCGEVIEQFLSGKAKRSINTELNYRGDIQRFLKLEFNKTINTITVEHIDTIDFNTIFNYREEMYGKLANSTINRHINTIKKVIEFLKARNIVKLDTSYFSLIEKLPSRTEEIEYMSQEVVLRYLSEAGKQKNYPKLKQSVIKFAAETGLRLDEVLNFELNQFTVDGNKVKIKGYGKGNKEYIDWIGIKLYEELLKTMIVENNSSNRLFHPLNTKNLTDMMSIIKRDLGYQDRGYSFHSFKKTAVTNTYRVTGCILAAQRKGRHSNLNTTRGYLKDEEFGVTGMFSLMSENFDQELYKKVSQEELLKALDGMNKDFLFLLNTRLREVQT